MVSAVTAPVKVNAPPVFNINLAALILPAPTIEPPELIFRRIYGAAERVPSTFTVPLTATFWSMVTVYVRGTTTISPTGNVNGGALPPHVTALLQLPDADAVYIVAEDTPHTSIKDAISNPIFTGFLILFFMIF